MIEPCIPGGILEVQQLQQILKSISYFHLLFCGYTYPIPLTSQALILF